MRFKVYVFSFFMAAVSLITTAQQADSTGVQAEPTSSQKMILYGMTALGIILLGLAFRNSKWGRRGKR